MLFRSEKVAAGRGLLTIVPERDGIVRRVPMMLLAQGAMMPSLSFEILRVVTGTPTIIVKSDQTGIKSVGVRGFEVPTDRNGQLWVHFARQDPSIYVSAADVLDGSIPVDKVDHKLVLIGTSAVGLNDIKTTPVSSAMPGVEIHAQVLEAALTKSLLSRPTSIIVVELLAAIVLGILVIILALVQLVVIVAALYGFNQGWNIEEERPIGNGEDYGAGSKSGGAAPQPA